MPELRDCQADADATADADEDVDADFDADTDPSSLNKRESETARERAGNSAEENVGKARKFRCAFSQPRNAGISTIACENATRNQNSKHQMCDSQMRPEVGQLFGCSAVQLAGNKSQVGSQ